jgi:hypothetical protein
MREVSLPIGSDLTVGSLKWAIKVGEEGKLGVPKKLVVGPENTFPAREVLYGGDAIELVITREFPMRQWRVVFENGIVVSQGPA